MSSPGFHPAYLFRFDGTTWSQESYVDASYEATAIALSADGNSLAIGQVNNESAATGINGNQSDESAPRSEAVYIYENDGTALVQQSSVKASNTEAEDWFGGSIAISADGHVLAIGALLEDSNATSIEGDQQDNSAPRSGAAYLY